MSLAIKIAVAIIAVDILAIGIFLMLCRHNSKIRNPYDDMYPYMGDTSVNPENSEDTPTKNNQ